MDRTDVIEFHVSTSRAQAVKIPQLKPEQSLSLSGKDAKHELVETQNTEEGYRSIADRIGRGLSELFNREKWFGSTIMAIDLANKVPNSI